MYIPKDFLISDRNEMLAFMKRFPFATIINAKDNFPFATHLPFLVEEKEGEIILLSHFARANPHWKELKGNQSLVIFSEPHAYISPSNYEKEQNVPTWNYMAVHASGQATILEEEAGGFALLEKTIQSFETEYKNQWDRLPAEYKQRLYKGVVPFEIKVERIEGKKKLSQNKTENERQNIITSLEKSPHENERLIAEYMRRNEG